MQLNWRKESWEEYQNNFLSELISPEFAALIEETKSEADKIALTKQVVFDILEKSCIANETSDPLGEEQYAITPFLVHQYKNRVLLLTTGNCFSHCRYCFRKSYTARPKSFIKKNEIEDVCNYILLHPEINEILISGGDPLTASFEELQNLLYTLRLVSSKLIFRICTRAPIFAPSVFTTSILSLFEDIKPLWLIPHINHVAELGKAQRECMNNTLKKGIAIQSQSVLLKGVNDNVDTLKKLFHTLAILGIKPGYLFQLDMAFGTNHFRVPLNHALHLWESLKTELSGLSTPVFAVDLMNGGGKFPLSVVGIRDSFEYDGKETIIKKDCNKIYTYSTKCYIKT